MQNPSFFFHFQLLFARVLLKLCIHFLSSRNLCGFSMNSSPLSFIFMCSLFLGHFNCCSSLPPSFNSFSVSSFNYPYTKLRPWEWRYIRVDVPRWFSSVSVELESDVDLKPSDVSRISKIALPLLCLRYGGLPLPDFSNSSLNNLVLESFSNESIREIHGLQNGQHCYPMQKIIKFKLTNEQILSGLWYLGLFNGLGAMKTRSKVLNHRNAYSFLANISVEGCAFPNLWGQYCSQTVESVSCAQSFINSFSESGSVTNMHNQTDKYIIPCRSSIGEFCLEDNEQKFYSVEIVGPSEKLIIQAAGARLYGTLSTNGTENPTEFQLMCYARYGAMPSVLTHDYATDINIRPLVIQSPGIGSWYVIVAPGNARRSFGKDQDRSGKFCYSLVWQVVQCPEGKTGFNCNWEMYKLQMVLHKNPPAPFECHYTPIGRDASANFPLEPLLSNSSVRNLSEVAWTYFTVDIPHSASGGNMHVLLTSDKEINYEIYARYGALPSHDIWDYFYVSKSNNSDGSMFFMANNSTEEGVDFYILFVREGTWNFAIKHPDPSSEAWGGETEMSISVERCVNKCSSPHGSCANVLEESGLAVYSYCSCDRTHGGFDCSVEIASHRGLKTFAGHSWQWQSISLIASNAAAILPAYWALRQRAFPEGLIYTCSGISSGLYHVCDLGTWCALNHHILQFMDFWLSFMVVVSTFVYLAAIDEASRRIIHAAVSIITALVTISGATRYTSILLVIAIGATGLLISWLIDLTTKCRSMSLPSTESCFSTAHGRQTIIDSFCNGSNKFVKRFHWGFVVAGILALTLAVASWTLETRRSYWVWHSIWHLSLYTTSFLFLCSMVTTANSETERPSGSQARNYDLARQDPMAGGE